MLSLTEALTCALLLTLALPCRHLYLCLFNEHALLREYALLENSEIKKGNSTVPQVAWAFVLSSCLLGLLTSNCSEVLHFQPRLESNNCVAWSSESSHCPVFVNKDFLELPLTYNQSFLSFLQLVLPYSGILCAETKWGFSLSRQKKTFPLLKHTLINK